MAESLDIFRHSLVISTDISRHVFTVLKTTNTIVIRKNLVHLKSLLNYITWDLGIILMFSNFSNMSFIMFFFWKTLFFFSHTWFTLFHFLALCPWLSKSSFISFSLSLLTGFLPVFLEPVWQSFNPFTHIYNIVQQAIKALMHLLLIDKNEKRCKGILKAWDFVGVSV